MFSCIADWITATRERSIPDEIADIQMKGQSQRRILRVASTLLTIIRSVYTGFRCGGQSISDTARSLCETVFMSPLLHIYSFASCGRCQRSRSVSSYTAPQKSPERVSVIIRHTQHSWQHVSHRHKYLSPGRVESSSTAAVRTVNHRSASATQRQGESSS